MAPRINYVDYFEVGEWKGIRNYQCKLCPFATVTDTAAILNHLRGHKNMPPLEPAFLTPLQPETDEVSEGNSEENDE